MTTRGPKSRRPIVGAALRGVALATGLVGMAPVAGHAASQQDEDACRPDVFRLCAAAIPDEAAIVACLDANVPNLGPACRAVMAPPPTPASSPRRRPAAP